MSYMDSDQDYYDRTAEETEEEIAARETRADQDWADSQGEE